MAIYKTKIIEIKEVADGTIEVSLKKPVGFDFKAGQYAQLGVLKLRYSDYQGASRVLSMASSPLDKEKVSFTFRDTGSGFKKTIKNLLPGDEVQIEGPYGFCTIPEKSYHPVVLIAGGIGITPYLSMMRFASESKLDFPLTLLYANRNRSGAAYLKELQEIANSRDNIVLKSIFGKMDEKFIKNNLKNIKDCVFHIAGPPGMIAFVRNMLYSLGVDEEKVFSEEFTGY